MKKDFDGFISLYHPKHRDEKGDYKNFVESKKIFFSKYLTIRVNIEQWKLKSKMIFGW